MNLQLYFWTGAALVILERVLHYRVITRYLRSRGLAVARGSATLSYRKEWKAYKAARLSENQPITWLYVFRAMQILRLDIKQEPAKPL